MTAVWRGGVQMAVYLDDDTPRDRVDAIAGALTRIPAVERVTYVSSAQAHERLRDALGSHAELLDGVEVGVLPASLEVELSEGVGDIAAIHPVIGKLRATPGVESVELLDDWAGKLAGLLAALRIAALGLALVAACACIYIVASTIRMSLRDRRTEMEVYRIAGATGSFIRGPLLIEGVVHGALGAVLAAAAAYALFVAGAPPLAEALRAAFGSITLAFLSWHELVALIAGGGGLGLIASWVATGQRHAWG